MKTPKPILVLLLLLVQFTASSQVQWYQNQDGNNQSPNGTVATSIQPLTSNSFVACYLWCIHNEQYTWKISKTNTNGTELKSFFVTGTTSMAEIKVGRYNSLYLLQRNFPFGQNAEYIVYKLDTDLRIKAQRTISLAGDFNIFNLNVFELDNLDNVYLAGDGQYPNGPGFGAASFVMKTDKNLLPKWSKMDSTQTSFTRLHVDHNGYVQVIADFYTSFPTVRIIKYGPGGQYINTKNVQTDAGRFSLFSAMDDDDNLYLYGGMSVGETAQAMYLYKMSRNNNATFVYRKTLFTATGSRLNDLKIDKQGNIFSITAQYNGANEIYKVSRINANSGSVSWNLSFNYTIDSFLLSKLVVDDNDKFYVVGEKRSHTYFSKGHAMRIRKSGYVDAILGGPDSVGFQRTHFLVDGMIDRNNQLIAIGNTNDFDTVNNSSSYFRSFAARYGSNGDCDFPHYYGKGEADAMAEVDTASEEKPETSLSEVTLFPDKTVVYPNPVQDQLMVSNVSAEEYDRIAIYNMQGAVQQQQYFNGSTARMDVSNLPNGVYLLILRSSATGKEKNLKFVVKR